MDMTRTQSFAVVTVCTQTGRVLTSPHWEIEPGEIVSLITQNAADHAEQLGHVSFIQTIVEISC